jgi:hypothetical protein
LQEGKVAEHDLHLLHLTDSPAEVVQIIADSQSALRGLDKTVTNEYRADTER